MHFEVPFYIWIMFGYIPALVIFNHTARGVFLNALRGQTNPSNKRRRHK